MLSKVKFLISTFMLLFGTVISYGQQVTFESAVPSVVAADEVFRIEFRLNAKPDSFTPPTLSGFEVIAGPSTSQGQSMSIINGKTTKSVSFTYTYVLQAASTGKFTIGAAEVVVDGKRYSTKPVTVEVAAGGSRSSSQGGSQSGSSSQGGGVTQGATNKTTLAADDIIVRVIPTRTSLYKGEPLGVTIKLYTRVPLAGIEGEKLPQFNGFWTQELGVDKYEWQREKYNDKVYDARVIKEYLLYPQRSGVLQIEQLDLNVVAQLVTETRRQSVFDDFFGGGQSVENVRRKVASRPISIKVNELPAGAPADFTGAVGKFTLNGEVSNTQLSANSAATYTVRINGNGNMPLIQPLVLTLPTSFEQYNVKTTESLNNTISGTSGYKQFEYPFIARGGGDFTINPVTFSYFDPSLKQYVTLSTNSYQMKVSSDRSEGTTTTGMVSGVNKEELKILGQDIRFIKSGSPQLVRKNNIFMWSMEYFIAASAILALFVFALIFLQKQIKARRNVVAVKGKKAFKKAVKQLKSAKVELQKSNNKEFYNQMATALLGYISDKLNVPTTELSKDKIREKMLSKVVKEDSVERFMDLVADCEFAVYAPSGAMTMEITYEKGISIISDIESEL